MTTASPIAKYKDPAELKKAGKEIANKVGGETVLAFFNQNKATIEAVLPKHINPERMLKIAMGALRTTPKLMACTIQSLFGAVVQCAQLGLEPNTPLGHVYLIPFEKKKKDHNGDWVVDRVDVQIVIGYKGMLELARRSGQIISIAAHEVCERDEFDYSYGLDENLQHRPAMGERGEIIAFYAIAKLKDGGHAFEVMSRAQVEEIRNNSQGYKSAITSAKRYNKPADTPWNNHFGEMGRKTVVRRLFKWLPNSIEMASAAALDDQAQMGISQGLDNVLSGEYSIDDPDMMLGYEQTESEEPSALPEQADPEPEIDPKAEAIKYGYGDVARALQNARNLEELAIAADLIREVPNEVHRQQLSQLYADRSESLQ